MYDNDYIIQKPKKPKHNLHDEFILFLVDLTFAESCC